MIISKHHILWNIIVYTFCQTGNIQINTKEYNTRQSYKRQTQKQQYKMKDANSRTSKILKNGKQPSIHK